MKFKALALVLVVVALCTATPAIGQTVYNPRIIQFDSPDHATPCPPVLPDTNCVSAYKVEVWVQGVDPATGKALSTSDLPKNKVVASGLTAPDPQLQANLSDLTPLFGIPVGQFYVVRMLAVGSDPSMLSPRSTPSGPFATAGAPRSLVNLRVR